MYEHRIFHNKKTTQPLFNSSIHFLWTLLWQQITKKRPMEIYISLILLYPPCADSYGFCNYIPVQHGTYLIQFINKQILDQVSLLIGCNSVQNHKNCKVKYISVKSIHRQIYHFQTLYSTCIYDLPFPSDNTKKGKFLVSATAWNTIPVSFQATIQLLTYTGNKNFFKLVYPGKSQVNFIFSV